MRFPSQTLSRTAATTAGAVALVLALVACTPAPDRPADASATPPAGTGLPGTHIHGLSVSGDTSQVLLATHHGLFDVTEKPAK